MIKYKIEDKYRPVMHEVNIPISKKEVQRIRTLLEISFEGWDDDKLEKLGIIKDTGEYVFGASFDNGATLDWKLCCGDSNYYDDVLFKHPSGEWEQLDCNYEFDDIEIDAGTDIYLIKLEIKDEQ